MSMTADRVDVPDFLLAFSAMHDAMRRDATRVVRFNDDRPDPLPARTAKPLAQWWQRFERTMSKQVSLGHIAFELPWVMDEADERVRALGKELLPAPVHL